MSSANIVANHSNFLNGRPEFRYYNYGWKTASVELSKVPRISEEVEKLVKEHLMTPLGGTTYRDQWLVQIPLLANFSLQQSELTQKEDRIQQCIANLNLRVKEERGLRFWVETMFFATMAFLFGSLAPAALFGPLWLLPAAIPLLGALALEVGGRINTLVASRKLSRALSDHDDFIKQCNETNARVLGQSAEFYRGSTCESMLRLIDSRSDFLRGTLDPNDVGFANEVVRVRNGTTEQRVEKLNKLLVIKAELLNVRKFYNSSY